MATIPSGLSPFSSRELEVLMLLGEGKTDREIAGTLGLAVRTVEHHVDHIRTKIGAHNRTEAAIRALRAGLIRSESE
jgi:DNA-binding NarL/FixJ family response regulator